jgi:hypothetical protein
MKYYLSLLTFCICITAAAQYKKQSGLSPFGGTGASQTFSFGGAAYFNSNFRPTPAMGFQVTSGSDRPESKWFANGTIRLFLPANYQLKTKGVQYSNENNSRDFVLKARTTIMGAVDYDLGRYFTSIEEPEGKIIPFALIGIGFHLGGFKYDQAYVNELEQQTNGYRLLKELGYDNTFTGHVRGGLGALYFFNEKTALRFDAAYHWVPDIDNITATGDATKYYGPMQSGILLQLRLHLKFPSR